MAPFLLLIIMILCVNLVSLLSVVEPWAALVHGACLQRIPWESQWADVYSALVCGGHLPEGELKKLFVSVGVIHLMVISGAHLIFLEKMWNLLPAFRFKSFLLGVFLFIYALASGLRPPVLRALFALVLSWGVRRFKLFWSPYWQVHISGMLCLLCCRSWVNSVSLQLSWLASMGMVNRSFSRIGSCALTYLLILPVVSRWGGIHPFSIVINWLIAPLASCLLLPLSMLVVPFNILLPLGDACWKWFTAFLNIFRPAMQYHTVQIKTFSSFQIWIYITAVFIVLHLYFVYSRRRTGA